MFTIPPLPVRPELFVAGCVVTAVLGLKLIRDGREQILGRGAAAERYWRRLLQLVGLPDTARASRPTIGATQFIVGLGLTFGSVALVLLNRPLDDVRILQTSWHQSLRPPLPEPPPLAASEIQPPIGTQTTAEKIYQHIAPPTNAATPLPLWPCPPSQINLSATAGPNPHPLSAPYEDGPSGALLVGFRVTSGGTDHPLLRGHLTSIQAIYQLEHTYHLGAVIGEEGKIAYQSIAPEGWILRGLEADYSRALCGLRCHFAPLSADLAPDLTKQGEWLGFGNKDGKRHIEVDGPVVGFSASAPSLSMTLRYLDARLGETSCPQPLPTLAPTQIAESPLESAVKPSRAKLVPREHRAPQGSFLVGLSVAQVDRRQRMAATYQRGHEYISEPMPVPPGTPIRSFLARPGYAIGGLQAPVNNADQLGVTFMRVTKDGNLDPANQYTEILGDAEGFSHQQRNLHFQTLRSDGRPVVGLRYNRMVMSFAEFFEGYQLLFATRSQGALGK